MIWPIVDKCWESARAKSQKSSRATSCKWCLEFRRYLLGDGYAKLARQLLPVVEQFNYGKVPAQPVTSPNLQRVTYTITRLNKIALEFDQPMSWDNAHVTQFYLDGEPEKIASGSVAGNTITLKLTAPSTATTISYLHDKNWSPQNLLIGRNSLAALTFFEVPLLYPNSAR